MKFWTLKLILLFGLETALLAQPVITKQPANQTASLFADATFFSLVSGDPPLSYQWRFNNAELLGATNRTLTVTNVRRSNVGNYNVVLNNLSGSVTSQVATLTITPFNALYAFGFSYTDTHNCDWPAASYWNRRPSNGPMWPEFLSTNLGMAYVETRNYAVCGNTTVAWDQVAKYPTPSKPELALYCLWLWGTFEFQTTNQSALEKAVQSDVLSNSNAVSRLYAKGARTILVESQFSADQFPRFLGSFGTNTALQLQDRHSVDPLNSGFVEAMRAFSESKPDVRIVFLDFFSKYEELLADPPRFGFSKKDIDALTDTALADKSFNGPGSDYVFWDHVGHPTSKVHRLISAWHLEALTNSILEKLEGTVSSTSGTPSIQMKHLLIGRDYTLQKSVDLASWQDVASFTASAGTNFWSSASVFDSIAYFRLKWQR